MNTIIPQAWIIQEKVRQENERRRREENERSMPISLPNYSDQDSEYEPDESSKPSAPNESRVIIIDL